MRSVMRHQFSQVPHANIPRSSFDRSHGFKTTMDASALIVIYVDEALPGDTFSLRATTFARLATPLHPIMDNLFSDVFFFAVPIRLVWDNFVRFMGEQPNPTDTTSFLVPTTTSPAGGYLNSEIQDYMGIPIQVAGITHNVLPLRCYNLIYNEWFRDQNLQNSLQVPKGDGPDDPDLYHIRRRGKRHDYFTSALPWPQKGPAVQLPLGSSAPVLTSTVQQIGGVRPPMTVRTGPGMLPINSVVGVEGTNGTFLNMTPPAFGTPIEGLYPSNLYADLGSATAATINQLRQAFQVQKIYERDARGGTRYTELVQSHFGVTSPDARLQRPEYLGGGSTTVNVNPIAQTSATGADGTTTPQGNLAGIGTFSHSGVGFTKSFTEHCYILGLMNIRADLNYQYGLNRMFSRSTRFDFYWPALAQIGEQTILNKEIYAQGTAADSGVFGYQERYAEYRYKPSTIAGQFHSQFAQPLDSWHLAQKFDALPLLNENFIVEDVPIDRITGVTGEPHFLLDCYFNLKCARPMPVYGVPGNIDRF